MYHLPTSFCQRSLRMTPKVIVFLGKTHPAKRIIVNHRFLIIYNDKKEDEHEENDVNPIIIHKISLKNAFARIRKNQAGGATSDGLFQKSSKNSILAIQTGIGSVELYFNAFKDDYKMYKWTEAVNQAADMIKNDTDPLSIVYRLHDIRHEVLEY